MPGKAATPMTYERLERAAYHYLQRFASSREGLRRVLERKIRRTNAGFAPPDEQQQRWIAQLLEKCEALGLVDDASFAEAKARGLARRGKSMRHIRGWLAARGVAPNAIETAIQSLAGTAGDTRSAEVAAAARLARRRRLGPYRDGTADRARREKELGAFARAGFALGLARAIVDAPDEAALAELADLDPDRLSAIEEDL